ncbi:hypothetical protein PAHAL_1G243300 [Panicum hallii]|uniref:Uncharacterized protein n=1 Tax=Panicum hallii TaxID=206008 RepID=A0A2T8KW66_9POAL|nr:hypothetical protein PAHAL_1G243300 [Panicum hallii]
MDAPPSATPPPIHQIADLGLAACVRCSLNATEAKRSRIAVLIFLVTSQGGTRNWSPTFLLHLRRGRHHQALCILHP